MNNKTLLDYHIDHIEIYTPMAKTFAFWHMKALKFSITACANADTGKPNLSSYLLTSGDVRLVLTSTYPGFGSGGIHEVTSYVGQNYCGVRRIALHVPDVSSAFERSISGGAIPLRTPLITRDDLGYIEEASIKLFDHCEIILINRESYSGTFKPGFKAVDSQADEMELLKNVDHIASEVRVNEGRFWSEYLSGALGISLVQTFEKSEENKTGMVLNINQSSDKKITMVISEPSDWSVASKVQRNISDFGPGIHHLAFSTNDLVNTTKTLIQSGVDFVRFPPSYYELLRNNPEFETIDIGALEASNILIDKEGDTFLLQKFIRPVSDRPFFIYEIVQRINGYQGFALKNINVLKKAEEMQIMGAK